MAGSSMCRWLVLGALISLALVTVCEAAAVPALRKRRSSDDDDMLRPLRILLQSLQAQIRRQQDEMDRSRRSCTGFTCTRNQVGHHMSRHAIIQSIMNSIHSCANDPSCSPGKRHARSSPGAPVFS